MNDLLQRSFSFEGRLPRGRYWRYMMVWSLFALAAELPLMVSSSFVVASFSMAVTLACFWPQIALSVQRLHDLDRRGGWLLLVPVPLVGLLFLLWLSVARGTAGPNRFGAEPGLS